MQIHCAPYLFEVDRCNRMVAGIWAWLEQVGGADWDHIHAAASYFHPAYRMDPASGVLDPNRAPGASVYLQMERGEYRIAFIRALAPDMWRFISSGPTRSRGKSGQPARYSYATVRLAAALACHEWERMDFAWQQRPRSSELIARHLYYFERFSALWRRASEEGRRTSKVNEDKATDKAAWLNELIAFHRGRGKQKKAVRTSMRDSAEKWIEDRAAKGVLKPAFSTAYLALRAAMK